MKDPVLTALDRRAPARKRSGLTRYLHARHDALLERLGDGPVDWTWLAGVLAEAGILNRQGNPPSPETARKAWLRTRKAIATARAKRGATIKKPPKLASGEIAAGIVPIGVPRGDSIFPASTGGGNAPGGLAAVLVEINQRSGR